MKVAFVWESLGPMHVDRLECVATQFPDLDVLAVAYDSASATYRWEPWESDRFRYVDLGLPADSTLRQARLAKRLSACLVRERADAVFFCNYQDPAVMVSAVAQRLVFGRCFVMSCSKFDDVDRNSIREAIKSVAFLPYNGALSTPGRSSDYLRFHGFRRRPIVGTYNTVGRRRFLEAGRLSDFVIPEEPYLLCVARLESKKDLGTAIRAFGVGSRSGLIPDDVSLLIVGYGSELDELSRLIELEELTKRVRMVGEVESGGVSRLMSRATALVLPSVEEQFGNVVIEAFFHGLPVLVSTAVGASDSLVRSWDSGLLFEPRNVAALAESMGHVTSDEELRQRLSLGAGRAAQLGDVERFAEGVQELLTGSQ